MQQYEMVVRLHHVCFRFSGAVKKDTEQDSVKLKTLRSSLGETKIDNIKNVYIRRTAQVEPYGHKVLDAEMVSHEMRFIRSCWGFF